MREHDPQEAAQLPRVEGLREKGGHPVGEPLAPVDAFVAGEQHRDASGVRTRLKLLEDLPAGHLWHLQIEHDRVRPAGACQLQRRLPIVRRERLVACPVEEPRHQGGDDPCAKYGQNCTPTAPQ